MSKVIIKIETGIVGVDFEYETDYTVEDWNQLSFDKKNAVYSVAVSEHIEVFAVDECGNHIED